MGFTAASDNWSLVGDMTRDNRDDEDEVKFEDRPAYQKALIVGGSIVLSPLLLIYLTPRIAKGIYQHAVLPTIEHWRLLGQRARPSAPRSTAPSSRLVPPRAQTGQPAIVSDLSDEAAEADFFSRPMWQRVAIVIMSVPLLPFVLWQLRLSMYYGGIRALNRAVDFLRWYILLPLWGGITHIVRCGVRRVQAGARLVRRAVVDLWRGAVVPWIITPAHRAAVIALDLGAAALAHAAAIEDRVVTFAGRVLNRAWRQAKRVAWLFAYVIALPVYGCYYAVLKTLRYLKRAYLAHVQPRFVAVARITRRVGNAAAQLARDGASAVARTANTAVLAYEHSCDAAYLALLKIAAIENRLVGAVEVYLSTHESTWSRTAKRYVQAAKLWVTRGYNDVRMQLKTAYCKCRAACRVARTAVIRGIRAAAAKLAACVVAPVTRTLRDAARFARRLAKDAAARVVDVVVPILRRAAELAKAWGHAITAGLRSFATWTQRRACDVGRAIHLRAIVPLVLAVRCAAAALKVLAEWLFAHVVLPVGRWTRSTAVAIRNAAMRFARWSLQCFRDLANWLYQTVILPFIKLIGYVTKVTLSLIRSFAATVVSAARIIARCLRAMADWLYDRVVVPAGRVIRMTAVGLRATANWLTRCVLRPCVQQLRSAAAQMQRALRIVANSMRDMMQVSMRVFRDMARAVLSFLRSFGGKNAKKD
jgi:hypothetical protein